MVFVWLMAVWAVGCSDDGTPGSRDGGWDAARHEAGPADALSVRDLGLGDRSAPYRDGASDRPAGGCGAYDICVDPVLGDDATGDGSAAAPYRTLSRAMAAAGPGERIGVRAGELSSATGEQFPIRFRQGVAVAGTDAPRDRPVLRGGDPAFVLADGASLSGFEVRASGVGIRCADCGSVQLSGLVLVVARNVGVEVVGGSSHVRLRDIWFVASGPHTEAVACSGSGIRMEAAGGAYTGPFDRGVRVEGCSLELSDADFEVEGTALVAGPGAQVKVRGCRFQGGRMGVQVAAGAAGVDLGAVGDPGGNRLQGARDADLCQVSENLVQAVGNVWDHDPPEVSQTCAGGVDVGIEGSGGVETE